MNKKVVYDPPIEVKESSVHTFSQQDLLDKVKQMYVAADGRSVDQEDINWLKQRLVDAALTQLGYDRHVILFVGQDMQGSFDGRGGSNVYQASPTHPHNNRVENYANNVEHTNFKVIFI